MTSVLEKTTIHKQRFDVDDFDRFIALLENRDRDFELIDGEIVEKMPTLQHGFIAAIIAGYLNNYALSRKLGWAVVEGSHRLPKDNRNSLQPDVSFLRADRPFLTKGNAPFMPDIAIEIKSPTDSIKQMRDKAEYFLANGSTVVWLVYPQHRFVEVYRLEGDVEIVFADGVLQGDDLLPGFEMPASEIFAAPSVV